jgi:hypothetical protein
MTLHDWLRSRWLTEHEANRQEIAVSELIALAERLRDRLAKWLAENHPELLQQ